jgi:hypothetical protein
MFIWVLLRRNGRRVVSNSPRFSTSYAVFRFFFRIVFMFFGVTMESKSQQPVEDPPDVGGSV